MQHGAADGGCTCADPALCGGRGMAGGPAPRRRPCRMAAGINRPPWRSATAFGDRQPKARSLSRHGLTEPREHRGVLIGGDAAPVIADAQAQAARPDHGGHIDPRQAPTHHGTRALSIRLVSASRKSRRSARKRRQVLGDLHRKPQATGRDFGTVRCQHLVKQTGDRDLRKDRAARPPPEPSPASGAHLPDR